MVGTEHQEAADILATLAIIDPLAHGIFQSMDDDYCGVWSLNNGKIRQLASELESDDETFFAHLIGLHKTAENNSAVS